MTDQTQIAPRLLSLIHSKDMRVEVQRQEHYYRAFVWHGRQCLRLGFGSTPTRAAADAFMCWLGLDIMERTAIRGPIYDGEGAAANG